jgi:hypothetical protein
VTGAAVGTADSATGPGVAGVTVVDQPSVVAVVDRAGGGGGGGGSDGIGAAASAFGGRAAGCVGAGTAGPAIGDGDGDGCASGFGGSDSLFGISAAVVAGAGAAAGAVVVGVAGSIGTPLPAAAAAVIAEPMSRPAAWAEPAQPANAMLPVKAAAATCSPFRDSGMAATPQPVLGVYAFLMLHRAISEKGE